MMTEEAILKRLYAIAQEHDKTKPINDWIFELENTIGVADFHSVGLGDAQATWRTWVQRNAKSKKQEEQIRMLRFHPKGVSSLFHPYLFVTKSIKILSNTDVIGSQKAVIQSQIDFCNNSYEEFQQAKIRMTTKVMLPRLNELVSLKKILTAKKEPPVYSFGDGYPSVSIDRLREMISVFPEESVAFIDVRLKEKSPVYFVHGGLRGLLYAE